jgi:hypothetical protein
MALDVDINIAQGDILGATLKEYMQPVFDINSSESVKKSDDNDKRSIGGIVHGLIKLIDAHIDSQNLENEDRNLQIHRGISPIYHEVKKYPLLNYLARKISEMARDKYDIHLL